MDKKLKASLIEKNKWIRFIFMVVFAVVNYVVQMIIWVVAAAQFIMTLITGKKNANLLHFGQGLSTYSYQIMQYLTYNWDEKPFPFASWPK